MLTITLLGTAATMPLPDRALTAPPSGGSLCVSFRYEAGTGAVYAAEQCFK